MKLSVLDKAELVTDGDNKPRLTKDGYLIAKCRVAKVGVQTYLGSELGLDADVVRVYRPPSSVFDSDSMASFAHKPITVDHPPELVNSKNYGKYAVGHMGGEIASDGNKYLTVPLMLTDAQAIDAVQKNGSELSAGYTMRLEVESGVTDEGESYDAVQHDIRGNHLSLVKAGRAGSEVRIGDSWADSYDYKPRHKPARKAKTQDRKSVMDVRMIMVDGLSVETTDAGAQAIEKLQGEITKLNDSAETAKSDHKEALDSLKSDHDKVVSDKDEEIGKLKGQVKSLEDAAMTPEKLDVLVADRSELIGKASKIIKDGDFNGKSDADIMKMCADEHYGKEATDGESEDVVRGMFKAIKVSNDGFKDKFMSRKAPANVTQLSDSQAAYERRIANGGVDPK